MNQAVVVVVDAWVLKTAVEHKIEFLEFRHQTYIPSMHASEEEIHIIDQKVLSLQQKHAIHKVFEPNGHKPSKFIRPILNVPKKVGGHRPEVNLKKLIQFVEYQHFKTEGVPMLKVIKTKRHSNQVRLNGCIPYCPNMDPSPNVPAIHLARHSVGVDMPSIRACECTPHVLKTTKTSCRLVKENWNQTNYLPRPHAHNGRI